jgi:pilus assembly protein CpaE
MSNLTFVVLSTGFDTFKAIRAALAADERTRLLAGGDDAEQVFSEIVRLKPSAAIVALDHNPEPALQVVSKIISECPNTVVICASTNSSPDLILNALRAGAKEFLRLPIDNEEFSTVVGRTMELCASQPEPPKKRGKSVAVFSSKGGCGTSFIATNVAAALGSPSVLVDLNLHSGDLDLFLGIEPKFSIADLVENRARIDDALLNTYLSYYSSQLAFLAAPKEADAADDIEAEHVFDVIQILRERFDYVVIDPQHTFDAITLAALDQVDHILLVLTLDIPAIRSTQRALGIFDRLGYPRHKIQIVVNRWSKQIDLELQQVEKYLNERVAGYVQSDYRVAVNSINLGKPIVEADPNSTIAAEIRKIASAITGTHIASPVMDQRKGLLGSIFRKQTMNSSVEMRALNKA